MATAKLMKERLRIAAARCIVHQTPEWWSPEITDSDEFAVADYYCQEDGQETPAVAATFLLLVAEAL